MTEIHLRKVEHRLRMSRFYSLRIEPNLFGEIALIREWGRIGQPGTVRSIIFDDELSAETALKRHLSRKQRRGYVSAN